MLKSDFARKSRAVLVRALLYICRTWRVCVGVRVGAWQTPVDIEGRQMGRHYTHRRNRGRELDTPLSDSAEWVALLIENGEEQLHNVGDAVCAVRAHYDGVHGRCEDALMLFRDGRVVVRRQDGRRGRGCRHRRHELMAAWAHGARPVSRVSSQGVWLFLVYLCPFRPQPSTGR